MAEALIGGALLGDAVSKSSTLILREIEKTWYFRSHLKEMKDYVENMRPIAERMEELDKHLEEETNGFVDLLKQADSLVWKCEGINWKVWKIYPHASKLDDMNKLLRNFVEAHLPVQNARDTKEIRADTKEIRADIGDLKRRLEKGSSSGWSSGVPLQKGVVVGFDDRVRYLKAMMLKDSPDDDCSVVVVSAAGGSGKTTFLTLFCHDPEIQEPEMKQCYLQLGLFPEDQKMAATALMDLWAHLYNHDEEGLATMNVLEKLSSRNLAALLPKRNRSHVIANHCEGESVIQHNITRELAIRLSSQEPIEHRETMIINAYGQVLPQLPQTINTRILSISTDERFFLTWNEIQAAPKVEAFVLNFMSNTHPLPQFMQNMKRLKVLIITNYGYYFSELQNFPAPQCLSGLTRIRLDHVSISSISTTILQLENLQKLSLIMCKTGNSFNEGIVNKLTNLLEIEIDSCDDLVTFPATLCNLARLRKLSITNCHELTSLSEEFKTLSNLEVLRVASCSNLTALPESVTSLKKLRTIDLSYCLSLHELPQRIGELCSLEKINATRCTGLHELPKSVMDFDKLKVVCDEEASHLWSDFKNVKVEVVEEDSGDTFNKIIPRGHI